MPPLTSMDITTMSSKSDAYEAMPAMSVDAVKQGRYGVVILTPQFAFKVQRVKQINGEWWSMGWSDAPANMVNASAEVHYMGLAADMEIAPYMDYAWVLRRKHVPMWIKQEVEHLSLADNVLITRVERVQPLNAALTSEPLVQDLVESMASHKLYIPDLRADNMGMRGRQLLIIDWGETQKLSTEAASERYIKQDLLKILVDAPADVRRYISS